jgi:hypothetical protein
MTSTRIFSIENWQAEGGGRLPLVRLINASAGEPETRL